MELALLALAVYLLSGNEKKTKTAEAEIKLKSIGDPGNNAARNTR